MAMKLTNPEGTLVDLAKRMGLGILARSVEEQKASGQTTMVRSATLPAERREQDSAYEALGFKFGAAVDDDPLFQHVELPEGWRKVASDHRLWSDIVDERGRKRASVFYKAAFYDRRAFARLRPRFIVEVNYDREDQDAVREWRVTDGDACGCGNGHVKGRACTPDAKRKAVERMLAAWDVRPTERLGQMLCNMMPSSYTPYLFSVEDAVLVSHLKDGQ
jgi:hypothetical protein